MGKLNGLKEPTSEEVRARIEAIPDDLRIWGWKTTEHPEGYSLKLDGSIYRDLFRLIYWGPRIAEVCFPKSSDFTRDKYPIKGVMPIRCEDLGFQVMQPDKLPMKLKTDLAGWSYYYKIIRPSDEVDAILKEFFTSEYEAALFTIRTEKRDGYQRQIAMPIDPKFEPWTKNLIERFKVGHSAPTDKLKEKYSGDTYVFPFTRGMAYHVARKTFKGFGYKIKDHEKLKDYGNHANRHITESRMKREYGFTDFDTEALLGHTHSISQMHEVYGDIKDWEMYFPKIILTKMLKRNN